MTKKKKKKKKAIPFQARQGDVFIERIEATKPSGEDDGDVCA